MELKDVSGIGEKTLATLERRGIANIIELLCHYPRTYRSYLASTCKKAEVGEWVSLVGTLTRPVSRHTARTTTQIATFKDQSGSVTLRWFNMPYLTRSLDPGSTYLVRGQLTVFGATRQIVNPSVTKTDDPVPSTDLVPLYPQLGTLKSGAIRKIIGSALESGYQVPDPLPLEIQNKYNLLDLQTALDILHRPPTRTDLEGSIKRLAFDELYALQKEALTQKELVQVKTEPIKTDQKLIDNFFSTLPYTLTGAQSRVIKEISADLAKPRAMRRLLAGEVGSGKTLVAATSALACFGAGKQTLVMAPTQILAEQLHASFTSLLGNYLAVSLITAGSAGNPQADLVVGTQSLLSGKLKFGSVGLVIVDEQHRFGVKQREYLTSLSPSPHLLMMTATPIPRTLAQTVFASLDVSRLDELPASRLPVKTIYVSESKRASALAWIKQEIVARQNQVFVVVPLIEKAEDEEGNPKKSLALLEQNLKASFPDLRIDIMHGKMKEDEKTRRLQAFRDGFTEILVATSMIEVGIDIPEANIIWIEDSERFGLASLHQLRGRVGRGSKQGYCLIFSEARSESAKERLSYFVRETNGEKLAEFDLKQRGPGQLYGETQHGFFSLRFASIHDQTLLRQTYEAVRIASI